MARMLFWFALAAAIAWLAWYMVAMPGKSYAGGLQPLSEEDKALADRLRRHVRAIASREHNVWTAPALEMAAQYIERTLSEQGHAVAAQRFRYQSSEVRNIEVEIAGGASASEIIVVGAHYDSIAGATGANDNGSGVAAVLELARLMRGAQLERSVRFVAFVNEEPPFYRTGEMGSQYYARRSRERGENVVAMLSLETIGYYSDRGGSQRYPFPLGLFYPASGNFVAFVSNLGSRRLLHRALGAFRRHAEFPSEGVAAPAFIPGVDWSDHWSFWQQGYPALMVTDTALYRYPWYHSVQDTPDKIDYERLARVVTGLGGMLEELAGR
ncbi:MAG: aminopeptidase [Betaproteobacteria bacterium RIFCSPLOWO2_12_FULL_66_14]|nr:MAG: aminopeptidase [Betaproteobacteria bacterium RIFCSPLOWO2_12_FULL_66_14]